MWALQQVPRKGFAVHCLHICSIPHPGHHLATPRSSAQQQRGNLAQPLSKQPSGSVLRFRHWLKFYCENLLVLKKRLFFLLPLGLFFPTQESRERHWKEAEPLSHGVINHHEEQASLYKSLPASECKTNDHVWKANVQAAILPLTTGFIEYGIAWKLTSSQIHYTRNQFWIPSHATNRISRLNECQRSTQTPKATLWLIYLAYNSTKINLWLGQHQHKPKHLHPFRSHKQCQARTESLKHARTFFSNCLHILQLTDFQNNFICPWIAKT